MNNYYPWCTAPETDCPHWIGTFCELDEEEIDFEVLERYLIRTCEKIQNDKGD